MGIDRSGGRSIDQIYQTLKQKSEQRMHQMAEDPQAETKTKAYFSSKNLDIAGLEHSLQTYQNSFAQA